MKLKYLISFLTGSLILFSSCGKKPAPEKKIISFNPKAFSEERAFEKTREFASITPRNSGSTGSLKAVKYIEKSLLEVAVEPLVEEFENQTPKGEITFRNVMAFIPGIGDKLIIVASHYDTKAGISETFQGANDSGSSTGVLLELARVFSQRGTNSTPPPNILLAFFDGEECMERYTKRDGLHGSQHLAKSLILTKRSKNVLAFILLDMIGDKDLSVTIPRNSTPELISMVFNAAHEENVRQKFSFSKTPILDDHVPFINAGIPAVDIIDFEYGSKPGLNDYWHTKEDTIDKLSAESLGIAGRITIRTINQIIEKQKKPLPAKK